MEAPKGSGLLRAVGRAKLAGAGVRSRSRGPQYPATRQLAPRVPRTDALLSPSPRTRESGRALLLHCASAVPRGARRALGSARKAAVTPKRGFGQKLPFLSVIKCWGNGEEVWVTNASKHLIFWVLGDYFNKLILKSSKHFSKEIHFVKLAKRKKNPKTNKQQSLCLP